MAHDPERLDADDIRFLRQMRRDWEGSTRIGCWLWRLFLALGAASVAVGGFLSVIRVWRHGP